LFVGARTIGRCVVRVSLCSHVSVVQQRLPCLSAFGGANDGVHPALQCSVKNVVRFGVLTPARHCRCDSGWNVQCSCLRSAPTRSVCSSILCCRRPRVDLKRPDIMARDLILWFASRDVHLSATFSRNFYWTELNMWPEDLPPGTLGEVVSRRYTFTAERYSRFLWSGQRSSGPSLPCTQPVFTTVCTQNALCARSCNNAKWAV
jgi:hypothetical protein